MNAQVTNIAGIARDAGVPRPTARGYFDVLVDTLIGTWLTAWQPRARVKEVAHPKFYFFDPGVVRAIAGRLRTPLESAERGGLLETVVLNELRAWMQFSNSGGNLHYWRTPSGAEVDFVWSRGASAAGIEVKSATVWRPEFSRPLKELALAKAVGRCFGVYTGRERLQDGPVKVLPLAEFMKEMSQGRVIP